jgi:serine/threonine-protein kinase HipA
MISDYFPFPMLKNGSKIRILFQYRYLCRWQEAAFPNDKSKSFFANLLPESAVRDLVARLLGVSEKNDFILLKHIGGECAGAISILPESMFPESSDQYQYCSLSKDQLSELIKNIPNRPLLAGEEGIRISLAGAQDKLPLFYKESICYIPQNGAPGNGILKPGISHFKSMIENEYFCMFLAGSLGLNVPLVKIIEEKHQKALYIERYDRFFDKDSLIRLHQEDFCQALGYSHEFKYQADGGPGLKECFNLVRQHSANPIKDIQQMLQWVFFNYLIGNMDAHAKNLSLLYHSKQTTLAPFYDLLCTDIYDGLSKKLAMKIGTENRPEWIMKRHWDQLASDINIRPVILKKQLTDFCHKMNNRIELTYSDFCNTYQENKVVRNIVSAVKKKLKQTLERIE